MTRRWSLRTRFVAAASLCLLPIIGVALFLINSSLAHSRDQLLDTEFAVSDVVAQSLVATIGENQTVLLNLAKEDRVRGLNPVLAQAAMDEVRVARPSLNGVFLLGPDNQVVTYAGSVDPAPLLPQFQTAADRALSAGEASISNKISVVGGDAEVVALILPVIPDPNTANNVKAAGAVGSFLSLERLKAAIRPSGGPASGETSIAIVAEGGQLIADSSNVSSANASSATAILAPALVSGPMQAAFAGKRGRSVYRDANGDERVAVSTPLGLSGANWAVLVTSPSPMNYGPIQRLLERGLVALGVAAAFALLLASIFGEMTARPLRLLTEQATAITRGDTSQAMTPVGRGEVADLSDAVHDMADRLTTQVRDTESARSEVARQAELLRDLLRRTVRLQEDERRRIASDIHDAVSPLITGALYQTRAIKLAGNKNTDDGNGGNGGSGVNGHGQNGANGHDDDLATVGDLLEKAMAELHDVVFALRPPDLDDLGVVAAIERYVQQINRTGLPCGLEVTGEQQRLSPETRLGVYRIVQEALHNALRHAHADEALVRMEWFDDRLRVTIRDNGSGFDPDQAASPTSLGLLSMRERAAAIGASFEIASKPGAGAAVILERTYAGDLVTDAAADPAQDAADDPAVAPTQAIRGADAVATFADGPEL